MRLPIRLRLTLAFALGMALVLSGLGAFLYLRLGTELLRAMDLGLRSRAEVIAAGIDRQNANFGDEPGSLVSARDALAQVVDGSGRVLESTDAVSGGPLLPLATLTTIKGPVFTNRVVDGLAEPTRLLVLPTGERPGGLFVIVGTSLAERRAALDRLLALLLIGGPAALALTSLAGWALAGAALGPVERMRREAADISTSPDRRLQVPDTGDEVARLAQTLNAMLERLEEAFGRQRRFVDEASHELRTPLGILKGELDLALARPRGPEELEAALRRASLEADHLTRLSEDLLVLSRSHRGRLPVRRVPVQLATLVEQAAAPFRRRAEEAGVELDVRAAEGAMRLDPVRVRQALDNLLENALRHVPTGGRVFLSATRHDGEARIVVEDTGTGFPEGFLEHAFEPFARGPQEERGWDGAGLGLAIVRAVAVGHGGSAVAENRPEGGARVVLVLKG